jgi:hypothetical protein
MRGGPERQCQREASHERRSLEKGWSERGCRREDPAQACLLEGGGSG